MKVVRTSLVAVGLLWGAGSWAGKPPSLEAVARQAPVTASRPARPVASKPPAHASVKPEAKSQTKPEAKPDAKPAKASAAAHPAAQARLVRPQKPAAPGSSARRPKGPSYPAVDLFAVNVHESLAFRPFDDKGRPRKLADKELTRLLRCWHTGKQHKVDPRLGRALYEVARHYAGHRLEIFSGYRPRAYCTRAHSRHLTAAAVDFRVVGVANEALIAWLRSRFHPAGVGYYPNGVHVHLDLDRDHDTYWVDEGDTPPRAVAGPDGETLAPKSSAPAVATGSADDEIEAALPLPAPPEDDPVLGLPEAAPAPGGDTLIL